MTDSKPVRLLVVDDEEDICAILKYNLEKAGYLVDTDTSAEDALRRDLSRYSLLLLDIMLGGMSGLEMASRLRSEPATADIPIIFITAKDTEADTLEGFRVGADDYISKPFSVKEVVSRVAAVLRRCAVNRDEAPKELVYKGIAIDDGSKTVTVDDVKVDLTRTEFEILRLLLSSPGRVFTRDEILSSVWPDDTIVVDRTVDVNITRLRKKIAPYVDCIVTRHGYGYCFEGK